MKALIIALLLMASPALLAEGQSIHIADIRKNDAANDQASNNNDSTTKKFTVTVTPAGSNVLNPVSSTLPKNIYYINEDGDIDCRNGSLDVSRIACEEFKIQQSINKSTKGIEVWTAAAAVFAFLAFLIGWRSIRLLKKSFDATQQQTILSFRPYFKITAANNFFAAKESKAKVTFSLNFRIKNIGKSPAENVSAPKIEKLHIKWPVDDNRYCLGNYKWEQAAIKTKKHLMSPDEDMPSVVLCVIEDEQITRDIKHFRRFLNDAGVYISFRGSFSYTDIECINGQTKTCDFIINQNVMTGEILSLMRTVGPVCKVISYTKNNEAKQKSLFQKVSHFLIKPKH